LVWITFFLFYRVVKKLELVLDKLLEMLLRNYDGKK
jgi:hypothetical protein